MHARLVHEVIVFGTAQFGVALRENKKRTAFQNTYHPLLDFSAVISIFIELCPFPFIIEIRRN